MSTWITPIITVHGFSRLRQRFNMKKERGKTVTKRAFNEGETLTSFKRGRYLGQIKKYGDMIFVFIGRRMLTAYQYHSKPLKDMVAEMEKECVQEHSSSACSVSS